jgi:hypothetical protein
MENEEIIAGIYQRIIDGLAKEIVELKVKLDYTAKMYEELYKYNHVPKVPRPNVMESQLLAVKSETDGETVECISTPSNP